MMKEISIGANLSKTYTNHCVRSTSITVLSDSGVPARHIMSISGHKNEQSLSSYNSIPSTSQLKQCSEIISNAIGAKNQTSSHQTTCFNSSSAFSASVSSVVGFPDGIFQSCNISQAQVFVLPPNVLQKYNFFAILLCQNSDSCKFLKIYLGCT